MKGRIKEGSKFRGIIRVSDGIVGVNLCSLRRQTGRRRGARRFHAIEATLLVPLLDAWNMTEGVRDVYSRIGKRRPKFGGAGSERAMMEAMLIGLGSFLGVAVARKHLSRTAAATAATWAAGCTEGVQTARKRRGRNGIWALAVMLVVTAMPSDAGERGPPFFFLKA